MTLTPPGVPDWRRLGSGQCLPCPPPYRASRVWTRPAWRSSQGGGGGGVGGGAAQEEGSYGAPQHSSQHGGRGRVVRYVQVSALSIFGELSWKDGNSWQMKCMLRFTLEEKCLGDFQSRCDQYQVDPQVRSHLYITHRLITFTCLWIINHVFDDPKGVLSLLPMTLIKRKEGQQMCTLIGECWHLQAWHFERG